MAQVTADAVEQQRVEALDKVDVSTYVDFPLLWETLSHCAEPADAEVILEKLGAAPAHSASAALNEAITKEQNEEGIFRVVFDSRGYPQRHPTWPQAYQLHVDEAGDWFYVCRSPQDEPEKDESVNNTRFLAGDSRTRTGDFGYRYACRQAARDSKGNKLGQGNDQIEFNYAEHKTLGEMLHLKWSDTVTTSGAEPLQLPNGTPLSYGEINGLGGDFFGGYNPVSDGKDLEERCKYFREAYDTLANGSKMEIKMLLKGREAEVKAIGEAVEKGSSTFEAYKELKKASPMEDAGSQAATLLSSGPTYARLAQINFDHFGGDAVLAYDAGHYCALQKAAEGTKEALETAYTMNAFADHYLGDCFASGHFRTPRRALHGSSSYLEAGWAAITGMIQYGAAGNWNIFKGATKVMVPDLLSMLMHNEDNNLGLVVKNKNDTQFSIWGDKQMNEPKNKDGKEMMRQSLQASVNEVYEAYRDKKAKKPEEGYRPWTYAPFKVVESDSLSHSALFKKYERDLTADEKKKNYWPIMVRNPFSNPYSKEYKPIGDTVDLINLYNNISKSAQWEKY